MPIGHTLKMGRTYRPKHLQYSRGQLLQAIEAVKKRNIKMAVVPKKYQVPLTTLYAASPKLPRQQSLTVSKKSDGLPIYLHKRVSCEATIHKLAQARLREIVSKIAPPYLTQQLPVFQSPTQLSRSYLPHIIHIYIYTHEHARVALIGCVCVRTYVRLTLIRNLSA